MMMELSKEWRDSLILEDEKQGDSWFIASRHLVPKQPVMLLKRLELTGAHILLSSRGLQKHQGEKNSTFCFFIITPPHLVVETFCSPEDTGPTSQPSQLALFCLPNISIKMVYWDPKEAACHMRLFIIFFPSFTPSSFRPFFFSAPSPAHYPGLP